MAAKKTAPKKSEATEKKTAAKAPKTVASKTAEATAAKTKPAAKPAAPKKPALKLTDKMKETLKKIHDAGEAGYNAVKAELRSIESLREKKLVKRLKVDKETGGATYTTTVAGKKHASA